VSGPFREGGPVPPCEECAKRSRKVRTRLTHRGQARVASALSMLAIMGCGAAFDAFGWSWTTAFALVLSVLGTIFTTIGWLGELRGPFSEPCE